MHEVQSTPTQGTNSKSKRRPESQALDTQTPTTLILGYLGPEAASLCLGWLNLQTNQPKARAPALNFDSTNNFKDSCSQYGNAVGR